jgi:hypothetical protein
MNLPQKDAQAIANGLAKMQKRIVNRRTDFEVDPGFTLRLIPGLL